MIMKDVFNDVFVSTVQPETVYAGQKKHTDKAVADAQKSSNTACHRSPELVPGCYSLLNYTYDKTLPVPEVFMMYRAKESIKHCRFSKSIKRTLAQRAMVWARNGELFNPQGTNVPFSFVRSNAKRACFAYASPPSRPSEYVCVCLCRVFL